MHFAVPVSVILLVGSSLQAFALPHGGRASSSNVAPEKTFPEIEQRSPGGGQLGSMIFDGVKTGIEVRSCHYARLGS